MIRCQISNDSSLYASQQQQQHEQLLQQPYLYRSKSLNDIFNDDGFIEKNPNLNINQQITTTKTTNTRPTFAHTESNQICNPPNNIVDQNNSLLNNNVINIMANNGVGRSVFSADESNQPKLVNPYENSTRNLNTNQCSRPANANVFNLCNPLSINLNGVTEQIGNLHL